MNLTVTPNVGINLKQSKPSFGNALSKHYGHEAACSLAQARELLRSTVDKNFKHILKIADALPPKEEMDLMVAAAKNGKLAKSPSTKLFCKCISALLYDSVRAVLFVPEYFKVEYLGVKAGKLIKAGKKAACRVSSLNHR